LTILRARISLLPIQQSFSVLRFALWFCRVSNAEFQATKERRDLVGDPGIAMVKSVNNLFGDDSLSDSLPFTDNSDPLGCLSIVEVRQTLEINSSSCSE